MVQGLGFRVEGLGFRGMFNPICSLNSLNEGIIKGEYIGFMV